MECNEIAGLLLVILVAAILVIAIVVLVTAPKDYD